MIGGTKPRSSNNESKSFLTSVGPGLQLTQKKYKDRRKG